MIFVTNHKLLNFRSKIVIAKKWVKSRQMHLCRESKILLSHSEHHWSVSEILFIEPAKDVTNGLYVIN